MPTYLYWTDPRHWVQRGLKKNMAIALGVQWLMFDGGNSGFATGEAGSAGLQAPFGGAG